MLSYYPHSETDTILDTRKEKSVSKVEQIFDLKSNNNFRKPLVGGNWKCNPKTISDLNILVSQINNCNTSKCDVIVCPSNMHTGIIRDKFTNGVKIAPQNCNFTGTGPYTGEMAVEQMIDMQFEWVLLGHSERRGAFDINHSESSKLLSMKLNYLLDKGMKCIFCIGEPLIIHKMGIDSVIDYCGKQLIPILRNLNSDKIVIAYEPIWSIGTGNTPSSDQVQNTHAGIRNWLYKKLDDKNLCNNIRIIYGGSVNLKNAELFASFPDVDGFLIGSASLKPEFNDIVDILSKIK